MLYACAYDFHRTHKAAYGVAGPFLLYSGLVRWSLHGRDMVDLCDNKGMYGT